jgi:hypothetical protein
LLYSTVRRWRFLEIRRTPDRASHWRLNRLLAQEYSKRNVSPLTVIADKHDGFRKSRDELYMTDPNRQEEDIKGGPW